MRTEQTEHRFAFIPLPFEKLALLVLDDLISDSVYNLVTLLDNMRGLSRLFGGRILSRVLRPATKLRRTQILSSIGNHMERKARLLLELLKMATSNISLYAMYTALSSFSMALNS